MALRPLITEEQIRLRVAQIAAEIDRDYPDGKLYLIGILKGACIFLADLARAVKRDAFIDFMAISSYGQSRTSSGEVKIVEGPEIKLGGAECLSIVDKVDS